MQRIAAFITALFLVALGVVAAPTASAAPVPANYLAGASADELMLDLRHRGWCRSRGRTADLHAIHFRFGGDPAGEGLGQHLAFAVDGLELEINSKEQTAPPNQGAPATETRPPASRPGLLSVGALDTSA